MKRLVPAISVLWSPMWQSGAAARNNDTSSQPPKDLGGTLRRASGTALRSWERLRQQRPRNIPSYRGRVANTVGKSTVTSQQFCPAAPECAFAMLLQNRRSSGAAGLFISAATIFPMEVW